jgi:signal transduction histidine kinase
VPPSLDNIGLIAAIYGVISNFRAIDDIKVNTEFEEYDEEMIHDDLKLMIYRIVQEQLNNIVKHSKASNVTIALRKNGDTLKLFVKDDGNGCDLKEERNGVGLQNINTRAALHHGIVSIKSSPGNGFELEVDFPI